MHYRMMHYGVIGQGVYRNRARSGLGRLCEVGPLVCNIQTKRRRGLGVDSWEFAGFNGGLHTPVGPPDPCGFAVQKAGATP
jgi:hypothetical protein